MNWTTPADLRAQLQKRQGEMLRAMVTGVALFPMRLTLKTPTSAQISDHFDQVRNWIADLRAMPHCRVQMREFRHRVFGNNEMPSEVWIDSALDAYTLIGKKREAARFAILLENTRTHQPQLLNWLSNKPLRALELFDDWEKLLCIVAWVYQHPHSGVYLRQVDIPGVHSKYIEAHRGVLTEWLNIVLPADYINQNVSGANHFAARYGFLEKPDRIRFRLLDTAVLPDLTAGDITLDAASFCRLNPAVVRVFITENEINFLAFPKLKDSIVIFGSGYGFESFQSAQWLLHCRIYYWGDIDTHGFAILDQLRSHFNHVISFLMDRQTLLSFKTQWGKEDKPVLRDLTRLTGDEQVLYDALRDNRIAQNMRLEQERIGFNHVSAALESIMN
jgi:hypothetical protein